MDKFVVLNAPFVRDKNDVNKMFLYTSVALMIPAVYGVVFFGMNAFYIILCSLLSCLLSEVLFNFINSKKIYVDNFSFFVTGLILALTLPYNTPIYVVIGSAFFSVFAIKQIFGGLGFNKFNPANCGRCIAGVICPAIASELYTVSVNEEVFVSITSGGTNSLTNLLTGQSAGGIGTTSIIIIAVCALFLTCTKVIDIKITLLSIVSYFFTGLLIVGYESTIINMFSGSFIFISVFMLTDPNTSPDTFLGKLLYSVMFGVIAALVWNFGKLGENSLFFVALVVNIIAPIIDKYLVIKPISYGGYRNAYKK